MDEVGLTEVELDEVEPRKVANETTRADSNLFGGSEYPNQEGSLLRSNARDLDIKTTQEQCFQADIVSGFLTIDEPSRKMFDQEMLYLGLSNEVSPLNGHLKTQNTLLG
jgi:hypothetical protein